MITLQISNMVGDLGNNADQALFWTVLFPLLIWLVAMIVFLWIVSKRYTLGKYGKPGFGENPYKTETMGIPRGMIRGLLSLTILIGAVLFQVYALRYLESETKIKPFMTAFEIMLGFYFGSKVVHHLAATDKNKVKAVAKAKSVTKDEFLDTEAAG